MLHTDTQNVHKIFEWILAMIVPAADQLPKQTSIFCLCVMWLPHHTIRYVWYPPRANTWKLTPPTAICFMNEPFKKPITSSSLFNHLTRILGLEFEGLAGKSISHFVGKTTLAHAPKNNREEPDCQAGASPHPDTPVHYSTSHSSGATRSVGWDFFFVESPCWIY